MDGFIFLLLSFLTILASSKEGPVDSSPLPPEPSMAEKHEPDSLIISLEGNDTDKRSNEENGKYDHYMHRSNYSRMLKPTTTITSTTDYDYWWFYPTRISQISLKDMPGRPGVASWKEITRGSSPDNRKSRKMTGPQAEGVSSGSWTFAPHYYSQMTLTVIMMILLKFCFF